jgi:hypothetical protein
MPAVQARRRWPSVRKGLQALQMARELQCPSRWALSQSVHGSVPTTWPRESRGTVRRPVWTEIAHMSHLFLARN